MMLYHDFQRIEITRSWNHADSASTLQFSDTSSARTFLRRLMADPFAMKSLRRVLAAELSRVPLALLNDLEIIRQLAEHLASGRLSLVVHPREFRDIARLKGTAGEADDAPVPPPPPRKPRTTLTWIKLRVIHDRTHALIPGVRLLVTLPNATVGEYKTGPDGLVAIDGITPGTCTATSPIRGAYVRDTYAFVALGEPAATEVASETPEEPLVQAREEPQEANADIESEQDTFRSRIALIKQHNVKTGESIQSIAEANGLTWQELASFNWGTTVPDEINEHLRDDVGCTKKTPDGYNYSFDDSDEPGILYIPKAWEQAGLATEQTHTIRVKDAGGFRVILENDDGLRIPEAEYEATLADGSTRQGRLGKSGIALIEDPPSGRVEVVFPDLDDVEAKSLAATVRKGFSDRDPVEVHRLFRYPSETVRRAFEAYDTYFNDYHGQGLRHDIEQEFFTDANARMVFYSHMARARMTNSEE